MRVVMIHAIGESIPPVRMAFGDVFPEAEVINLLDEGLLIDFGDKLTPKLIRRMSTLVAYAADHGADAIGLACSVYAPTSCPVPARATCSLASPVASRSSSGRNRMFGRYRNRESSASRSR